MCFGYSFALPDHALVFDQRNSSKLAVDDRIVKQPGASNTNSFPTRRKVKSGYKGGMERRIRKQQIKMIGRLKYSINPSLYIY